MKNTRLTDLIATRNDDIGIENYRIRYATERCNRRTFSF